MVKLRLTRMGSINKPFYRVIAIDSRCRRDGQYLDNLGYYDTKHDPSIIHIDEEKALKWLKVGAQPSETVRSLFSKVGIMKKWHEMRCAAPDSTPTPTPQIHTETAEIHTQSPEIHTETADMPHHSAENTDTPENADTPDTTETAQE